MFKELAENRLVTKFIIIQDAEEEEGLDLFLSILKNHSENATVDKICLICYENPSDVYLKNNNSEKISTFNFFNDPIGWDDKSKPKFDWSIFDTNPKDSSKTFFFIDSLSFLVMYYGFYAVYECLSNLRKSAEKIVCLCHGDVMTPPQLEELKFLSSAYVKILPSSSSIKSYQNFSNKTINLNYRKPGGKVINQTETISVSEDLKISNLVQQKLPKVSSDFKSEMENLTTFKLGLEMSDNEKRIKDQLVLPYLRSEKKDSETGDILYVPDLEDDPDDDLDV